MRSHRRFRAAALVGSLAIALSVPAVANAAAGVANAVDAATRPAPVFSSTVTVTSTDVVDRVLHHRGDPAQGSITAQTSLQYKTENGRTSVRAFVVLGNLDTASWVQIDTITVTLYRFIPAGTTTSTEVVRTDRAPLNSFTQRTVSKGSPWYDVTGGTHTAGYFQVASADFRTRWADGTVTAGHVRSGGDDHPYSRSTATASLTVDAAGAQRISRNGVPAQGTVTVSAGIRLHRIPGLKAPGNIGALQPFATISKGSQVSRVQIDGLEAIGYPNYLGQRGPEVEVRRQTPIAWPYNLAARSSGDASSVSLSTAIVPVDPTARRLSSFIRAQVYYSIRWSDGSLSRGSYLTPYSAVDYAYNS